MLNTGGVRKISVLQSISPNTAPTIRDRHIVAMDRFDNMKSCVLNVTFDDFEWPLKVVLPTGVRVCVEYVKNIGTLQIYYAAVTY